MVLESVFSPEEVEKQPLDMLILGFGATSLGAWLAYYIFPQGASSWFLFLTTLTLVPLMYRIFFIEEDKDDHLNNDSFLKRHEDIILVYLFMFFGMIIAVSFWFTILPESISSVMFADQIGEVMRIQGLRAALIGAGAIAIPLGMAKTGLATAASKVSGEITSQGGLLKVIMLNNLRLLFLFFAFSFVFGAGSVLLLTWNAAVIGVAIGNLIKETIIVTEGLLHITTRYFTVFPFSFLSFFVHGIFEVLGYFIAAIGGGILSAAIVRKHYNSTHFTRVLLDVGLLVGFATILIVFGAYVEVYITPIL